MRLVSCAVLTVVVHIGCGGSDGGLDAPTPAPAPAPPYAGTIFMSPQIITEGDPTTLVSVSYTGRATRTVYDRRPDAWVTVDAHVFDAVYGNGDLLEVVVNPEFGDAGAATVQADLYAAAVGRLPAALRFNLRALWIHAGDEDFGGGNESILIHAGRGADYRDTGFLEEALVHEGAHTSLDWAWGGMVAEQGWKAAQQADGAFISEYAQRFPDREDVAESFLAYLAVRARRDRLPSSEATLIEELIPHRLAYFDSLPLDLSPLVD